MNRCSYYSDLLYSQKLGQSNFLHLWPQQLYRASRFDTHTYIASVLNYTNFRHSCAILCPLVATNTQKGDLNRTPCHRIVFWVFSHMFWDMNLKSGIHIQWVARHIKFEFHYNQVSTSGEFSKPFSKCFQVSTWKLVCTLIRLHDILSSHFTRMGSLWPTSCS